MSRLNKREQRARGGSETASESPAEGDSEPSRARSRGRRERAPQRKLGAALAAGGRATGGQLLPFARSATAWIEALLVALGRHTERAAALLLGLLAVLAPYLQLAGRLLHRAVGAASRVLTPSRAIALTAIGCALLLAASQFADYRGVGIGTEQYRGLESVAPAPEVDRRETGSAHSYLLLPAALLAIAALLLAVRTRRWRACRIAAAVGIAAILVSLLIDRPQGLDPGDAARDFVGVEATLLGGFWMQLFAGLALTLTSLLLASELRREPVRPHALGRGERGRGGRRRRGRPLAGLGGTRTRPEGSGA
jgi:uncharacterized membrane protein